MFLPTRAGVEEAAELVRDEISEDQHRVLSRRRADPRDSAVSRRRRKRKPYFLAMTAAGQSALNVQGLDTVVIDDTRFSNVIERGKNVLTRMHLGANEILQMAGRVHGRVEGGRVFILSDRDINFATLKPDGPGIPARGRFRNEWR